jgi:VIT1/CCC1 family predicted Fe2+/Mn2+ transporter
MIVAKELTKKDPEAAHFDAELKIDPNNLTDPWHAAFASAGAFIVGSIIPISAVLLTPASIRIPFTFFSVLIALALTGTLSAKIGGADVKRAIFRVVTGGALAMAITYGVGRLFNVSGI